MDKWNIDWTLHEYSHGAEFKGDEDLGLSDVYIDLYWPDSHPHPVGWIVSCQDEGEEFVSDPILTIEEAVTRGENYIKSKLDILEEKLNKFRRE